MWAGSLEGILQCWDLRNPSEPQKYQLDSQVRESRRRRCEELESGMSNSWR